MTVSASKPNFILCKILWGLKLLSILMCVSTVKEGNRNDKENIGHAVNFDTVITYIAFLTLTMSMNVNQT